MIDLSVGCGGTEKKYWKANYQVSQLDVNIDIRYSISAVIPNFILSSVEDLPFRGGIFGSVESSHLLEHLDDPIKAVKECKRVSVTQQHTIPNGFFVCALNDLDHKWVIMGDKWYRIPTFLKPFRVLIYLLWSNRYIRWVSNKINKRLWKWNELCLKS